MYQEIDDYGHESLKAEGLTFNELADHLEENYLIPPEYVNGRKVAGKRSYKDDLGILKVLRDYFGRIPVREITWGKIEKFRVLRFKMPTRRSEQRSVARVNRELSLLRHALKIAIGEGWLHKNPFVGPKPLIHTADEVKRKRVLERDEEMRLLEACRGPRDHLFPIIICAIDTGMRRGEIFKLKWSDLDWAGESLNIPESRAVNVQEFNTKTLRARPVPITKRLKVELQTLWEKSDKDTDDLVFGITNNISKSFATACHTAEIGDLRFHDLRRTFGTRLAKSGVPIHEISRLLGHTNLETTFRYLGLTEDSVENAAAVLDRWNEGSGIG
jgi:integrase